MTTTQLTTLSAQITELVKNRKGLSGDEIVTEVLNAFPMLQTYQVEALLFEACAMNGIPITDDLGHALEELSDKGMDTLNKIVTWAKIAYTVYKIVAGIFGLPISDKAAEAIELAYQAIKGGGE